MFCCGLLWANFTHMPQGNFIDIRTVFLIVSMPVKQLWRISVNTSRECIEAVKAIKAKLTHWGRVKHICVSKLPTIDSDNGLSPGWRQAIIWTNAGILLFRPLGSNFSEILIEIDTFSFKKMHLKLLSAKWRPFCLGLNVLNGTGAYFMRQSVTWS